MKLLERWRTYRKRSRDLRIAWLRMELGQYWRWGDGPGGTSNAQLRAKQAELARLERFGL